MTADGVMSPPQSEMSPEGGHVSQVGNLCRTMSKIHPKTAIYMLVDGKVMKWKWTVSGHLNTVTLITSLHTRSYQGHTVTLI